MVVADLAGMLASVMITGHRRDWGLPSGSTLPFLGVTAGMKAGDDGYGVGLDAKDQGVGESAHKSAAYVMQHYRKLQCVVRNVLDGDVELAPESHA